MFSISPARLESAAVPSRPLHYPPAEIATALLRVCDFRRARRPNPSVEEIESLIAKVLGDDLRRRRYSQRIRLLQGQLRHYVNGPTWRLYLSLEEAEVQRWTYMLDRLAEWTLTSRRRRVRR